MSTIISIVWFLIFLKLFIFWLWLWQLKQYHWGRFKAHFERQKIRKLLFSLYGIRYPGLTPKIIVILISGIVFWFLIIWKTWKLSFQFGNLVSIILIILAPLISSLLVLFFQVLTKILRKRVLEKARRKREQFKNLIVIGITGSYGKSSTKEFLATILSEKFRVLKTPKNINAEIGIAEIILKELSSSYQIFIAEIGAYERGKIKEVCQMLQPQIGILSGINEQHLSTFGSQENIIQGKFELIESLPENGVAILNGDNKIIQNFCPPGFGGAKFGGGKIKLPSLSKKSDIWVDDVKIFKESVFFKVFSRDGSFVNFGVDVFGRQNIENILLAISCAKELGMSLEEISLACLKIKPEQAGMRFLKKEGPVIIDSSYSANPDGVIADLEYLKIYPGRKIIIIPCLIELGKAAKGVHQRIARKIAEVCDLAILTTKDYFFEVKKVALSTGMNKNSILFSADPNKILKILKPYYQQENVILLEGRVPKELIQKLV